jgi:predicted short-subunit dehydrogenase-like oxidoreductase (DUF2520 family)
LNKPFSKIGIIGSGNVATALAIELKAKGYNITEIYSRKKANAEILAKKIGARVIEDLAELNPQLDLVIIAVTDDAIAPIVSKIKKTIKSIVHTSGSVALSAIKKGNENYGVFYPLQTFSKKRKVDFKKIPFCIEANNAKLLRKLRLLAKSIGGEAFELSSKQRLQVHLAAVITNNFTNHLLHISQFILKRNGLPSKILYPLLCETIEKAVKIGPAKSQTGPAIRGDSSTIKKHLGLLPKAHQKDIYIAITKSIQSL